MPPTGEAAPAAGAAAPAGGTFAGWAVMATCLVALVSVLVTALVAVPLASRTAWRQAGEALAAEASLVAVVLRPQQSRAAALDRIEPQLGRQQIELWLVTSGEPDRAGLPGRVLADLRRGEVVSGRVSRVGGRLALVEGRPLGDGDAVVLTRRFAGGVGAAVVPALWLPLLAGLAAGALSGTLLARRLSRPLRQAAAAAARLRTGDRRVRVPVGPPAESAALAAALNDLASALAASEGRQREFLLSVSHELRTPLTTIRGYAEALADRVVDADGVPRAGRTILAEAEHLERLVTDLLALARSQADDFPLEIDTVDPVALVREVVTAWAPRFHAAGVPWRVELPEGPMRPVRTDRGRLRQVLDGLIGNALRVVPAGAPVVLRLSGDGCGDGDAPGTGDTAGTGSPPGGTAGTGSPPGGTGDTAGTGPPPGDTAGAVRIEIRDGGPGFTDADLDVAFEPGVLAGRYRGSRKVGSGLGLALAARLVRRMGGTIEAGHASDGGARFTIVLPPEPAVPPYLPRTLT